MAECHLECPVLFIQNVRSFSAVFEFLINVKMFLESFANELRVCFSIIIDIESNVFCTVLKTASVSRFNFVIQISIDVATS